MDVNRNLFNTFARMRKLLLLVTLATVLTYSCKTDFDVTSDWKDISIVYGLLDPTDTAQYIKVTKAFLDKKVSALTIAQIPDSLYYTDITVQLEQYQNSVLKKTIDLQKVDGNLEGYVKDTGIFANAPNYLYKTKEVMDQNSSYKLVITISDNGKIVTSSTEIINDFLVTIPSPLQKVNFKPGAQYHVQWTSAKDGKIYGLVIRFHYKGSKCLGSYHQCRKIPRLDHYEQQTVPIARTAANQCSRILMAAAFTLSSMQTSTRTFCIPRILRISILSFQWVVKSWTITTRLPLPRKG
jgi:hypothetical protein